MTRADLLRLRLANHALARARFRKPEQAVAWFGAVQAQDYLGSLWGIGQRLRAATEATVEAAETRRAIVRLWPMRGTLHFVAAADVRWMTQLLAPRVIARNAARIAREIGVDSRIVARSRDVVTQALQGGGRLERTALYEALEARRIRTGSSRGLHILGWLAQEGTICLAGRQGKQHTFALLDEWIPKTAALEREASLAELASRYFTSHGPASLRDFMWWAGLTAADAQAAIDGAKHSLAREMLDGVAYWRASSTVTRLPDAGQRGTRVSLLPAFDEYTVAYHERAFIADTGASKMALLSPAILVDGKVVGNWTRKLGKAGTTITARLHRKLTRTEGAALQEAARSYGTFIGLETRLLVRPSGR